jgi:hypothetical protein
MRFVLIMFSHYFTPFCCYLVLLSIDSRTGFAHFFTHADSSTSFADIRSLGLNANIDLIKSGKSCFSSSLISAIPSFFLGFWIECSSRSSSNCRFSPSARRSCSSKCFLRSVQRVHISSSRRPSTSICSSKITSSVGNQDPNKVR